MHAIDIPLATPPTSSLLMLLGLVVGLLLLGGYIWRKPMPQIAKYASLGLLLGLSVVFCYVGVASSRAAIVMSTSGVSLAIPIYDHDFKPGDILIDGVRRLDLTQEPQYQLSYRRNGVGLLGYSLGWFDTKGTGRALVSVTAEGESILLPTKLGYSVIVTVAPPQVQPLLDALGAH
ncbi:PH domain-containing protein [Shewanella sp. NIFS-20-20]|uniref:PH domain-containing protein n=1 Tax=Shewanella sp. NIFS-20-20 TaxID=2853806 RepID=UPI001C48FD91|nr:PH domain-containing protein [Shewanella sp. NIFS-20-20]MBV7315731.1 PH domain-containing protein [Shewanella sp. NIFS-20-20]